MLAGRLPIAVALFVVLLAGLGLAAMRARSELAAAAAWTLAELALLTAVLGAILLRGRPRAACLGFALFGWSYLVACYLQGPESAPITAPLLNYFDSLVPSVPPQVGAKVLVRWQNSSYPSSVGAIDNGRYKIHYENFPATFDEWIGPDRLDGSAGREHFVVAGHSLFAVVFATLGAAVALYLLAIREQTDRRTAGRPVADSPRPLETAELA